MLLVIYRYFFYHKYCESCLYFTYMYKTNFPMQYAYSACFRDGAPSKWKFLKMSANPIPFQTEKFYMSTCGRLILFLGHNYLFQITHNKIKFYQYEIPIGFKLFLFQMIFSLSELLLVTIALNNQIVFFIFHKQNW